MFLLIFEFIGTQEFMLILVAALILFGPRKLPGLARSLGKGLAQFKSASEEFKAQWEREVEGEVSKVGEGFNNAIAPPTWDAPALTEAAAAPQPEAAPPATSTELETVAPTPAVAPAPMSKHEWL